MIEALYKKQYNSWLRVARSVIHNQADADDALSIAVVKMMTSYNPSIKNVERWARCVVYSTCIDFYRKEKRKSSVFIQPKTIEWYEGAGSVEEFLEKAEELQQLIECSGMCSKHKHILSYIFVDGYTYADCSKQFNVSHNNICKIVSRWRKNIEV